MTQKLIILIFLISIGSHFGVAGTNSKNENLEKAYTLLKKYGKNQNRLELADAIDCLKVAADENNGDACYLLSEIYDLKDLDNIQIDSRDIAWIENGHWGDITHNEWSTHKTAFDYLLKACNLGHQKALFKLACAYADGHSYYPIESDNDRALELFLHLDDKDSLVEYKISKIYWVKGEDEEALRWMTKASKSDPKNLLPELARMYRDIGDKDSAIKILEEWTSKDKYKGKLNNYILLLRLLITKQDWEKAIEVATHLNPKIKGLTANDILSYNKNKMEKLDAFRQLIKDHTSWVDYYAKAEYTFDKISIEHGDFRKLTRAALHAYEHKDYETAYRFLTLDSKTTDFHLLGLCYYYGQGTEQDYKKAVATFSMSKDSDSLYHIGLCYYNGQGVDKQDYDMAFEYFSKACSGTHRSIGGMEMLSRCYRFGRGCEIDEQKADYWLEEAAKASEKAKEAKNALRDIN